MTANFSTIDLSRLPAPSIVESLDFESIFAAMLADLRARDTVFTTLLESDPAYKILEVAAYRELLIRQRVNDAARAVMLAYAAGADLDQIGFNFGVQRLIVTPADDTTIPPTVAVYETDDDFRGRIQLSPEAYTTAGSEGSYIYHGLAASGDVKDIQAVSPGPGEVVVYVLGRSGTGAASSDLLATVNAALNAERVRPMTDHVTVLSASIVTYIVQARLTIFPGPDPDVVRQAALDAVTTYVTTQHRIGLDITRSGLFAALHQPGVQNVALMSPPADVVVGDGQAGYCTAITVTVGGTGV